MHREELRDLEMSHDGGIEELQIILIVGYGNFAYSVLADGINFGSCGCGLLRKATASDPAPAPPLDLATASGAILFPPRINTCSYRQMPR